ncbi:MAG: DUF1588 domain-containing protein, partial [Planctomycetota bacterium]
PRSLRRNEAQTTSAKRLLFLFSVSLVFGGRSVGLSKELDSFSKIVTPFLTKHCVDCHSGEKPKAGFDISRLSADFSNDEVARRWVDVMHSLQFGEMPPVRKQRPDPIATADVIGWVFRKMDETGRYEAYQEKLLAPEYGNWVSHEKLFSGKIDTPPFSPSRLWRLSPEIFRMRGYHRARSPFTYVTPKRGVQDYSATSGVDRSTIQMILVNVGQWLEHRQKRGEFERFADPAATHSTRVLEDTVRREFRTVIKRGPTEEELAKYTRFLQKNIGIGGNLKGLETTIKAMFLSPEAIYRAEFGLGEEDEHGRRRLSTDEIVYAVAYALTDRGPEHTDALRKARSDGQLSTKDDVIRVVRQMLEEEPPKGRFDRPRLPRIKRFFEQFFGYDQAGAVFKDNARRRSEGIPQWSPRMYVDDARLLIEYILEKDKDVIAELLTTNRYFIAHPGDNKYAKDVVERHAKLLEDEDYVANEVARRKEGLDRAREAGDVNPRDYESQLKSARRTAEMRARVFRETKEAGMTPYPGFPFGTPFRGGVGDLLNVAPYNKPARGSADVQRWDWPIEQPLEMPKQERAGLLTHPAWLAAYSTNEDNDPIHRGIWIRERLLAGVLQDVPPDVDAKVSQDPHKTLRERMEPLRAKRCWGCHRKINPLGEPFEAFDDWGRYRSEVYFDEEQKLVKRRDRVFQRMLKEGRLTSRKLDTSGAITGSGDPKVDGEVLDAVEMLQRLGRSDRARQSFIRHLFRYFMGRNEMLSDSKTLIEAERAYLENGGSFKALVVSLLSSDSFLYRR